MKKRQLNSGDWVSEKEYTIVRKEIESIGKKLKAEGKIRTKNGTA